MFCRWDWGSLKYLKKRNFAFAFKRLAGGAEGRTVKRELGLEAKDLADAVIPGRDKGDYKLRSSSVDREKQS